MNKIILSVFLIAFFLPALKGQCKFKSSGPFFSLVEKRSDVSPGTITKPRIIFDKFSVAATQFFIKSEDNKDYFGFSFFRSYSAKFEVLDDNPIILMLEGGHNIKLFPTTNYEGRRPGMSIAHFQIVPVYNIDEEQIKLIANNPIAGIRFYLTAETDIANTEIDDTGRFFDFEIKSEKFKNNIANSASCFLQHKI